MGSPTTSACSGGRVARVVAVREPSTSDTGITRGPSGTSQRVRTSRTSASWPLPPVRRSMRTIRSGGSWPGTLEPTCKRRVDAARTTIGAERLPVDTIAGNFFSTGSASWNGWVHRHWEQRAVPSILRPSGVGRSRATRRMRWRVALPHISHMSSAAWSPASRARSSLPAAASDPTDGPPGSSAIGESSPRRPPTTDEDSWQVKRLTSVRVRVAESWSFVRPSRWMRGMSSWYR